MQLAAVPAAVLEGPQGRLRGRVLARVLHDLARWWGVRVLTLVREAPCPDVVRCTQLAGARPQWDVEGAAYIHALRVHVSVVRCHRGSVMQGSTRPLASLLEKASLAGQSCINQQSPLKRQSALYRLAHIPRAGAVGVFVIINMNSDASVPCLLAAGGPSVQHRDDSDRP